MNNKSINKVVSIVTPVYNGQDFIEETINSVLSQDYENIEYIVVNDGSTDDTYKILSKYKDHIKIINQDNSGQSSALNNGWGLASGDYIGYLSADDTYELNAISNLVECLESNPNAILSYGDWSLIDSNSKQLRGIPGSDYSKFDLKNRLACVVGPGSIFKRDIYSEYGGWDTDYRKVPDFEYFFRICESGDFIRVKRKLANFRIHSNSYSSAKISKKLSDEIITLVKKSNPDDNFYKLRLASAHLISFKWHLISNRPLIAINRIFLSIFYHPLYLISLSFYRVILSSIFNGLVYRVKRIEKS